MGEEQINPLPTRRPARIIGLGLVVLVCLMAIAAAIWFLSPPREPSYQGKPASYWLDHGMGVSSEDDPKVKECREAFQHMGTNVIPVLIRRLSAKDSALKEKFAEFAERQDMVRFRLTSAEEHKYTVRFGFEWLGDLATNAVPALLQLYSNPPSPQTKWIATEALTHLYPLPGAASPYWLPPEERPEWYLMAGGLKFDAGDYPTAAAAFSEAIRLAPTNLIAYISRAEALIRMSDQEGAMADIGEAMQLSTSNDLVFHLRGMCDVAAKDFNAAEADFTRAINLNTNSSEHYHGRAIARANARRFDDALVDLNQTIELDPNNSEAYRNRSMIQQMRKEYELALDDVSKAMRLYTRDPMIYVARGRIRVSLKDYPLAISDFDKAIELDPTNSMSFASRAGAKIASGDYIGGAADIEKSLQLNPENANAFFVRGFWRMKQATNDAAALADFQRAAELAPQVPEAHALVGLFQRKLGQWDLALTNCHKAIALRPAVNVGEIYATVWIAQANAGHPEAGNDEMRQYLASLPAAETNEWNGVIARFFTGACSETNFLNLARTCAKRPSAVPGQVCDSFFYAGMKRKISGDRAGALALFQKCVDTRYENSLAYFCAADEIRATPQTK